MKRYSTILACVMCGALPALWPGQLPAGTIHTLGGKTYEGNIEIKADGLGLLPKSGVPVTVPLDDLLDAAFPDKLEQISLRRGLVLISGDAIQVDDFRRIDDTTIVFVRAGRETTIPLDRVARIIFRQIIPRQLARVPAGHSGALLDNGDFFEGEFKGCPNGRIKISSVIFGLSDFDPNGQAPAVILSDVQPAASDWIVRLADSSVLLATSVKIDNGRVHIDDPLLGIVDAVATDLLQIQCGQNRLMPLTNIKPQIIKPADDANWIADSTLAGVPMRLAGYSPAHGIGASAGTSLTYNLDGNYRAFVCRIGVASGLVPVARVRFIVSVDGKEVYHSPERTSVDDPIPVCADVRGAKTITLTVQSADAAELGAEGLWADPSLVRKEPKKIEQAPKG